ncbi:MAG: hypothetical protein IIA60_14540, partial [Candidatus Marinimicrobia bacterium]|nr:hypothetical protein [Candidatus Neomarinimicrobiota bacterium]
MYRKIQIMATVFIMGTFQVSAQIGTGNGPLFIGINEADLTPQQAVRLNTVRYRLTTTETRIVRVSDAQDIEQLLYSKSVQLNLYEDLQFEASWERTEIWGENEFTWIGTPPDTVGHVILTVGEQGITGSIWAYGVTYSIVPLGQGAHVIYRVDQTKFIPEHPPGYGSGALEPRSEASSNGESAAEGEDDRSSLAKSTAVQSSHIYDVLVAYTGAAKNDAGGASAINNLISTVISKTNQIYGNSSTTPRAALVLKVEVNYTES